MTSEDIDDRRHACQCCKDCDGFTYQYSECPPSELSPDLTGDEVIISGTSEKVS